MYRFSALSWTGDTDGGGVGGWIGDEYPPTLGNSEGVRMSDDHARGGVLGPSSSSSSTSFKFTRGGGSIKAATSINLAILRL